MLHLGIVEAIERQAEDVQDAMAANEQRPRRITKTRAKNEFGLTVEELDTLDCLRVTNPHDAFAAPMCLYRLVDVSELRDNKLQRAKEEEQRREAERLATCKRKREEANAFVRSLSTAKKKQRSQEGKLGLDEWEPIMLSCLSGVSVAKVGSIVGAVRTLLSASHVCKELNVATSSAWAHLASLLPNPGSEVTPYLDRALSNPESLKLDELKQAARALRIIVGGTKAELIHRIFKELKLSRPTHVPCSVIQAYHQDQRAVQKQEYKRIQEQAKEAAAQQALQRRQESQSKINQSAANPVLYDWPASCMVPGRVQF